MNRLKAAFDEIQAEDSLKADTFDFVVKYKKKNRALYAVAACIMALVLCGGVPLRHMIVTEAAYVEVNTDRTVAMSVNSFGRIIDVSDESCAYLKGKSYTDGVSALSENFDGEADVCIISKSENKSCKMSDEICSNVNNAEVECSNPEIKTEAEELGVTPGKYRRILQIIEADSSKSVDECRDMTMNELNEMYKSVCGEDDGNHGMMNGTGTGNGNGSGAGNGNGAGSGSGAGNGSGTGSGKQQGSEHNGNHGNMREMNGHDE